MKSSLQILACFVLGIVLARLGWLPTLLLKMDFSLYALYALMIFVGISMGSELQHTYKLIKTMHLRILLVPFTTVVGTLLGMAIFSFFSSAITLKDSLAIGSGMGYYSLSSIYIGHVRGDTMGAVALIANLLRELISLLLIPAIAKWFGKLSPIASAGATSMDTCLPIITQSVGKQYALISVFHGTVLTILVPFLVSFILGW